MRTVYECVTARALPKAVLHPFSFSLLCLLVATAPAYGAKRISDVEIAIAARACLDKGMNLFVIKEDGKPVATTCIRWHYPEKGNK